MNTASELLEFCPIDYGQSLMDKDTNVFNEESTLATKLLGFIAFEYTASLCLFIALTKIYDWTPVLASSTVSFLKTIQVPFVTYIINPFILYKYVWMEYVLVYSLSIEGCIYIYYAVDTWWHSIRYKVAQSRPLELLREF